MLKVLKSTERVLRRHTMKDLERQKLVEHLDLCNLVEYYLALRDVDVGHRRSIRSARCSTQR